MSENAGEIRNQGIDEKLMELIETNTRKVPYFYEEGICNAFYIPVEGGEIRVFHHTPKKPITKRPILFAPGFGTSMWAWRDFSLPFVEQGEFYFLETREKKSSKFKNRFRTKITVKQVAQDIGVIIHHLGLDKKDFVLFGTSYCGGAILKGLIDRILTAPSIVLVDPAPKLTYYRGLIAFLRFLPPFIIGIIRYLLGSIALSGENNKAQRERSKYVRNESVPWKWRKASTDMLRFNILNDLSGIKEEVIIFHGPPDKHHAPALFEDVARRIPKARFFSALSSDDKRELACAVIGLEFCKIRAEDGIPDSIKPLEKSIAK